MAKLIFSDYNNTSIDVLLPSIKRTFWTQTVYDCKKYIGYISKGSKTYYPWDGRRHDYTVDELQQIVKKINNI